MPLTAGDAREVAEGFMYEQRVVAVWLLNALASAEFVQVLPADFRKTVIELRDRMVAGEDLNDD